MKALLLSTLFSFFTSLVLFAQTGPGGVGNSSNNILWLDASTINVTDNTLINTWSDISGNNNHSTQINSSNSPLFRSNRINGLPSLQFDGVDDFLNIDNNITTGNITLFAVYLSSRISMGSFLTTENHILLTENNKFSAFYDTRYSIIKYTGSFNVVSMQTNGDTSSNPVILSSGSSSVNFTRNGFRSPNTESSIGNYLNLYFQGYISELIIYDDVLNSAKRKIISNSLAAKYNLNAEQNLYSYKAAYNIGVKGIGQEADGNHLYARGQDSLALSNASSLGNGDYVLVGHNNAGYSTTAATGPRAVERWNQVWKADITGTPGTVDLEFFLGGNGFASNSNYIILMETADGDFTNGGTSTHETGRSYNAATNSIKFTDVNLVDGVHFTLAEKDMPASSTADGNWEDPENWSCGCVPGVEDIVINQHNLTIHSNQSVLDITILSGGSLNFSGSDTLFIHGDLTVGGTINAGSGTIAAVNNSTDQYFFNNSADSIDFYNLYVNNESGLILQNGNWGLSNNLEVASGGLDVSSANSITLFSNSTSTAQILPSIDSAFTGDFIIQRYIGPRNAGWADLSSPIENATAADWDDDLYISGINGNDGNVTYGNGSIYHTMFTYDYVNDVHEPITSTSTPLVPGKGYELWLADNSSSFFGKTIDVVGRPNNGSYMISVDQGWNFVGNPYQSFIAYDSITKSSWIPDNYYIWNTHNGSYDFFNGSGKPAIAPGQGFWIHKIPGGHKLMEFTENVKINSNSYSFLRQKRKEEFSLTINSSVVPFSHKMQLGFSSFSSSEIDEKDAYYLKSKLEEAPAITTRASDSNEELIYNSLNSMVNKQSIPISVYAGVPGEYEIAAENLNALNDYYNCVYLFDKQNNASIDLMIQSNYTFEADKGKHDRFNLIMSNSYQECREMIEDAIIQDLDDQLSLRNEYDQWYLDYDLNGKSTQMEIRIFNMSGQEVKASQSFEASGTGAYQLKNLEALKGIYLIQVKSSGELLNKTIIL